MLSKKTKKARLTDSKDSNIYLPLKSIAMQAGVEFVRDNLGFKDLGEYYDESRSISFKQSFYYTLIERGWFKQDLYLRYSGYTGLISKYVHFIYKTYSSNANDYGIIAKFKNKEVELTHRGTTRDFLTLDKIVKTFAKEVMLL